MRYNCLTVSDLRTALRGLPGDMLVTINMQRGVIGYQPKAGAYADVENVTRLTDHNQTGEEILVINPALT